MHYVTFTEKFRFLSIYVDSFQKCIMLPLSKYSVLVNLRRYFSQMHYVTTTEMFRFLSVYVNTFRKCIMLPLPKFRFLSFYVGAFCKCIMLPLPKSFGSCQCKSILFASALCFLYRKIRFL